MGLTIGIPAEQLPGERRIALVPDVAKRFKALGVELLIQRGAEAPACIAADDFKEVSWTDSNDVALANKVVLAVQPLSAEQIAKLAPGTVLVSTLQPYQDVERVRQLAERKITAFAMELLPRISRAQSMDILSSQAACSGYQCVLIAASHCTKFFPMMTYAAGTIRPAKVLVIGAGVAGLQAIATARRLGALVEAYDVRPETREQIESLGAKFVDTGVSAAGTGGYARELTEDEKRQQAEKLARAVAQCDALITTAAIPGKRAPQIISADMVAGMKPGAVVVDMAAESGGNVAGTVAGETVVVGPATIVGPTNLPSRMALHASEMYAKNLYNFVSPMIAEGELVIDWTDEVIRGTCLTHDGEVKHEGVKKVLGL
jgi:NAD(P) transhydrogenase subunit alpha